MGARRWISSLLSFVALSFFALDVNAQEEEEVAGVEVSGAAEPTTTPEEATLTAANEPAVAPAPPAAGPSAAPEEEEQAPPAQESSDWTDGLSLMAFADAYAQGVWTLRDPLTGDRADVLTDRAFTTVAGVTLSFLGLNVAFDYQNVGARLDVRFGTSVPRLLGPTSGLPDGMQFLKQAYVFWRPFEGAQIDFGQFDTIYGAEVSESWRNHNYSRGALYMLVQPFYHTGFRLSYSPLSNVTITGLAVNGWNNVVDNNDGKTFGLQGTWTTDNFRVATGYLAGPETHLESAWRHFVDLVLGFTYENLEIIFNGDYIAEDQEDGTYNELMGAMLSGRLRFPPLFAVALRGEVIADPEDDSQLVTGTLTLETTPIEHLVIRLDNIVEWASDDRFQDRQQMPSSTVLSTILGVVVHSD